ncbi:hypothetical protein [Cellulomonas fimi]|uniref:Uncharacterized protein n=1 Tax=Cellulomonas fimi TaxID=1708 RepID=A0A7Y0QH23_CELFI|nr:hypothetical protein [Cellulomonas fimi]NMR20701.1 hypothetical protein [Cellulomonas fimi]
MSTPTPPAAHAGQPVVDPAVEGDDENLVEPEGVNAGGRPDAPPKDSRPGVDAPPGEHDVRAGGHAAQAPRSLTESEARWHEHESSGAGWDSQDSI